MTDYSLYRVVVASVIYDTSTKKILISKRHSKDENQPGVWAIPAGHVELDQSNEDSLENNLKREVKEEIDVEISNIEYIDSHSWVDSEYKKVTIVFLATIKNGEPIAGDETDEIRWVNNAEISSLQLAPHIERLINKAWERLNF